MSDCGKRGRKSKYCDADTKLAVSDYAKKFGPSAAAKKFGIPPSVASYYYRKSFGKIVKSTVEKIEPSQVSLVKSPVEKLEPSEMSEDVASAPPTTSPTGILRTRGRGRPKLIGDELDAALVEFMVNYKKTNGFKNLSTHETLEIAKQYIKTKSPGLLDDDGGHISLKHTWALKLQTRIAEREQGNGNNVDNNSNIVDQMNTSLSMENQLLQMMLLTQLCQQQNLQLLNELATALKTNESNNNNNNKNVTTPTIPDEQNYQAALEILSAFHRFQDNVA